MKYVGFAISDTMFHNSSEDTIYLRRFEIDPDLFLNEFANATCCANSSHVATINALRKRGIELEIPEVPPKVELKPGDELFVISVSGLPRLTDRREYTDEEIGNASFVFSCWEIQ